MPLPVSTLCIVGLRIKVFFKPRISLWITGLFLLQQKLLRLAAIATGGAGFLGFVCAWGGDEKFYSKVLMPTLHRVSGDPERAHSWAVWAARNRLFPKERHLKSSGVADMDLVRPRELPDMSGALVHSS